MNFMKIINRGLELGLTEIEVYANEQIEKTIDVMDGKLETIDSTIISGVSIRGKYNGQMGYVYYENIKEDEIDEIINKIKTNAMVLTSEEEEILFDGKAEYTFVEPIQADYDNYTVQEKIEMLLEIEKNIRAVDKRIVKISPLEFIEAANVTKIINSKGLNLERKTSYLGCVVGALAIEDNQSSMGYAVDINYSFAKIDKEKIVKEATEAAILALGADSVPTGAYPVVFHRDCMTDILAAFSGIFSSETALKKMTRLIDKEGEKIFGDNINLIDDPFEQNAIAKISFDDEGYPCFKKAIVENGVFKTFFYNLKTAKHYNKQSTGNGFKAGASSPVRVQPTNFYLEPGQKTLDEIIASVEDGLYVTNIAGLHAGLNPISGDFNVQSSGRLIKNGKLDKAVTLFVISGNFFDMMNEVEEIANNLKSNYSSIAAPAVKIKSLAVSGK